MVPFDIAKLTELMERAEMDLLLASTRHNVRYLTGGYYYHFHEHARRMGTTRYLPFVGLPRGRPDAAFYVGSRGEDRALAARPFWIANRRTGAGTTSGDSALAAAAIRGLVADRAAIGVELPFLPADAFQTLQRELPHARWIDATDVLTELRAIKTAAELATIREVSARDAEAIRATFRSGYDGVTTRELAARVQREMADRGLTFLWAFTCAGPSYLRAPSEQTWQRGRALHLDCGGEIDDYLADICRMGALGQPSALAREMHAACVEVQDAVRRLLRPGVRYGEVVDGGDAALQQRRIAGAEAHLTSHGIGMVSHEQPMLNVPAQRERTLQAGHVCSVETEYLHPDVGHVKIEDTIAITPEGGEGYGDLGRDWQIISV